MATNSKTKSATEQSERRVLVARFSSLGDVAMAIPVVYDACHNNPDTRFIFLTKAPLAPLFVNAPSNLTVKGVDVKSAYKGIRGIIRLFNELYRDYRFDTFVDLHDVLRTRIIGFLCRSKGIKISRIKKGRVEKKRLTRQNEKCLTQLPTSIERYTAALNEAGIATSGQFTSIYPEGKADTNIFADLASPKVPGEKWIAIAPFAAHESKIYPLDKMERVVAELSQRPNVKVFLFGGGPKEKETLGAWSRKYENVVSLADQRHGFPKELALLSNADVMVSMDSSNMHLSAMVGVPSISIWGATHPYCGFAGWNAREDMQIQLPLACRPCSVFGNKPCAKGTLECLNGIAPKTIIDKIYNAIK